MDSTDNFYKYRIDNVRAGRQCTGSTTLSNYNTGWYKEALNNKISYKMYDVTLSNYNTGWYKEALNNKISYKMYNVTSADNYWTNWKDHSITTGTETIHTKYNLNSTNNELDGIIWRYDKLAHDEMEWFAEGCPVTPLSPGDRMRQMIQARMAPAFHRRRTSLSIAIDVREERARQTLRRIIGDQAFKKFIRDGFITVISKSGLTYRIYPGHGITEVYDRGIMVDRLCVVLQGSFPPTDSLLMRYLLILNDEGEFSKYAIKHHVSQRSGTKLVFPIQKEVFPLTEALAALKLKVA